MKFLFAAAALLLAADAGAAALPAPPPVAATAWGVFDYDSGRLLAGRNARVQLEPASVTKLMTAYVAFEALQRGEIRLDQPLNVSTRAWKHGQRTRETRMFLDVGSQVRVSDLLRGLIVQSGNDASVVLAEGIGGSEAAFVERMNAAARRLGMARSHFSNPNGMHDAALYTTAEDLALLARALIREFPEYYGFFREHEFTYNHITQRSRNRLLVRDPSVDGLKTGYHRRAGYCIVTSAQRQGRRVIAVILGARTSAKRLRASAALLDYGFLALPPPAVSAAPPAPVKS